MKQADVDPQPRRRKMEPEMKHAGLAGRRKGSTAARGLQERDGRRVREAALSLSGAPGTLPLNAPCSPDG